MQIVDRYFEDFVLGETRTTLGRTVTEADVVLHAGQTGDFFPHHVDAEWSAAQDFGGRIAHGTLILSMAVGMTASDVNPQAMSYGYDRIRFIRPVHLGDTITATTEITGIADDPKRPASGRVDELVRVTNQRGEIVLALVHLYVVHRRGAA